MKVLDRKKMSPCMFRTKNKMHETLSINHTQHYGHQAMQLYMGIKSDLVATVASKTFVLYTYIYI